MAFITTPRSQSLRFISKNEYLDSQTYDNRFVKDLIYANTLPYYYVQQFIQSDTLWCQFRTDYNDITVNLVNNVNSRVELSKILIYTDSSLRNYYEFDVDLSSLSGCYFVEIIGNDFDKPELIKQSEIFSISESIEHSLSIEWFNNNYGYDDQMHWDVGRRQMIRLICMDRELSSDQNKTVYTNAGYYPMTLKSKPLRLLNLIIDKAPFWIIEKINIGLSHDEFYVNGIRYNTDAVIEIEKLGDLLLNKASIQLTQFDFEDGEDKEVTGEPVQSYILFNNLGDYMLYNDSGDLTKANN